MDLELPMTGSFRPEYIEEALSNLSHELKLFEEKQSFSIPSSLNGLKILNLGSNQGQNTFLLQALVGETGHVIGIEKSEEKIKACNDLIFFHKEQFGYKEANVKFLNGNIEHLDILAFKDESFDLIVSNQGLNMILGKKKLLKEAYRVLREGGEFYFNAIYADRRLSDELCSDPNVIKLNLSQAPYIKDFLDIAKSCGFHDPRIVEQKKYNTDLQILQGIEFNSITYRLFKIKDLEDGAEDYGQMVRYNGGVLGMENAFRLDTDLLFPKGKWCPVSGNTYLMLNYTRFENHFDFAGDFDVHFGRFNTN